MHIIICLDDKNGIRFNGRRQSKDSILCDRILEITKGSALWMNAYSAKLFPSERVNVDENFLERAGDGAYCFAESNDFLRCFDSIEKVILYRWNRVYPSDVKINMSFLEGKQLVSTSEFKGNSHDRITEERYE